MSNECSLCVGVFRGFSISCKKSVLFDEIVKLVLGRKAMIMKMNRVKQAWVMSG